MSNFTPGPWEVGGHEGDLQIWPSVVFDNNRMPITIAVLPLDKYDRLKDWPEDGGPSKMMEANARLIAAAPEMYDLLRRLNETPDYFEMADVSTEIPELLQRIDGEERG